MHRICLSLMLASALLATVCGRTAEASALDADTMKVALRTATPEEGAFIDRVVTMAEQGTLPVDLVESTFLWAKKKPRNKFHYFKQGLILRAAERGIAL